ncbi:uncharacterized protein NECHADRAFT_73961 [Fusarium vanettenii 77-13-4]|uniref:Uncharacterized protein n=5 Tax=Fusarium TaxID=5506 RepID=C7ZC15_FUSV7|nr:uncharacterized protein NECHADRAFT_73961 [Fusarium vanettenii 77-13-4]AAK11168.1 ESP3 [Fusarium vanettenii]AAK18807.1 ESP3 [Fusarium haematococcum]EEU38513.1 predicted protein [Fusarium vanettenii 77-13-4]
MPCWMIGHSTEPQSCFNTKTVFSQPGPVRLASPPREALLALYSLIRAHNTRGRPKMASQAIEPSCVPLSLQYRGPSRP